LCTTSVPMGGGNVEKKGLRDPPEAGRLRGEETAKMADGGRRPGIGISGPACGSWLAARRSWLAPNQGCHPCEAGHGRPLPPPLGSVRYLRPWKSFFASAAGTIESSHAARARGNRGDRFPFLCFPKPRQGRLRGRSVAPEGAQRQRKGGAAVIVPRARAPWLLSSAPTSGLGRKPFAARKEEAA